MAAPRVTSDLWVHAHLRVCAVNNVPAVVVRRGDATAGGILLKVNGLDGRASLLTPSAGLDGERLWVRVTGPDPVPEADADQRVAKAVQRDPDLWVIEMEDRQGRHFLTEPVAS